MSVVLEKASEKLMTADEFFYSPYSKGFELVRGRVVPKGGRAPLDMPAGGLHGFITNRLGKILSNFVDDNRLGAVFAAETGFIFAENTVRGLDVAFVGREKLAQFGIPEGFYPSAPDLAVEVASPGNSSEEMIEKVNLYLRAGSRLVWVIYPKTKLVQVYRASNLISLLRETDALQGEDVLHGFELPLAELFGNLPQISQ